MDRGSALGIALLAAAAAACAPSYAVKRPSGAIVRHVVEGPSDGIGIPDGMRLVAAYGDDAGRVAGYVRVGAAVNGRRTAWDDRWIYILDEAARQPVAAVALPVSTVEQPFLRVTTIDDGGTRVAALANDGSALYWPALDAEPVRLVPLAGGDPEASYRPSPDSRDEDAWAIARAQHRLSFSPSGDRLLAGMHLWDLSKRRDLFPLRPDEIVLDATHERAIVARIGVRIEEGEPGSQCGFVPTWRRLVLEGLELRAVGEAPVVLPPRRTIPINASAAEGRVWWDRGAPAVNLVSPVSRHPASIAALDVADDGRLVYVQEKLAWLIDGDVATTLRLAEGRYETSTFDSVTLGDAAIYAVVSESEPGRSPTVIYAFDAAGAARVRVPGWPVEHVSRAGRAIRSGDHIELWDVSGTPHGADTGFEPQNFFANDQGRALAGDRLVLRDSDSGTSIFEVRDRRKAPRRLRAPLTYGPWTAADDGSTLASVSGIGDEVSLDVLSLDDGRVLLHEPLTKDREVSSVAVSAHVIAAGDVRGKVRVWRDGKLSEIDLWGRFDIASRLAISPNEKLLAIGTARGRIYVVALD